MKKSKLFIAVLTLSPLLLSAGCAPGGAAFAGRLELASLQVIQTLALDAGEDGQISVTSVSSQGTADAPPAIITHEGGSIQEAMEKIQDYSSKEELFYPHLSKILIGGEAARQGIGEFLDFFERVPRVKLSTDVFIVQNGKASELVTEFAAQTDSDLSAVLNAVKRDVEKWGKGKANTTAEIARDLSESGCTLVCGVDIAPVEGVVFSDHPKVTATPAGYVIMRDGRMVGTIPFETARGVNLVNGDIQGGALTLHPETGGGVTLELIGASSKLRPLWNEAGGLDGLRAEISVRAGISSVSDGKSLTPELIRELEIELSENVNSLATEVLELSKAMKTDFLRLGERINRAHPVMFSRISGSWPETLGSLDIKVHAEALIDRGYDMWDPAKINVRPVKESQGLK